MWPFSGAYPSIFFQKAIAIYYNIRCHTTNKCKNSGRKQQKQMVSPTMDLEAK